MTSVGTVDFREHAREKSSGSLAGVWREGGFIADLIAAKSPWELMRGESVGVASEDWPGCSNGRSDCSEGRSGWLSSLGYSGGG